MLNEEQDLLPVEQQTLIFYGKPIMVVRLPDGRPGVVLRFLCENLQIDTAAQMQRIRRTEAIAEDLVFAVVGDGCRSDPCFAGRACSGLDLLSSARALLYAGYDRGR